MDNTQAKVPSRKQSARDQTSSQFYAQHRGILDKLNSIDFANADAEISSGINYLNQPSIIKNLSESLDKTAVVHDINELSIIASSFSRENIKKFLDKQLVSDMKALIHFHDDYVQKLTSIVLHEKIIQNEYSSILKEINSNEGNINELIEFYSEYLQNNKNFLIRNEILKTFLEKVVVSKEDKDNLLNKNSFEEIFFQLIMKMINLKNNIDVIQKNSEKFSKNLLFSIKENYNLIDDLLNEKIVIYLKTLFRTKKVFEKTEFHNIISTLNYLKEKENYLNFVMKEYTQMRKKILEEQLKGKYLKTSKFDEIFSSLIEDFEFYFLKEFVILFALFNDNKDELIFRRDDWEVIYGYLNYSIENVGRDPNKWNDDILALENFIARIKGFSGNCKEISSYTLHLNSILYILEELFYQNINVKSNITDTSNLSEIYKITILSYYYSSKLDMIFASNQLFCMNNNLNLYSMITNYKKTFSNLMLKLTNDNFKHLNKLQKTIINTLNDDQLITNESNLNKFIICLVNDYSKMFEYYQSFNIDIHISQGDRKDKDILCPMEHSCFKLLIDLFNTDCINNETNLVILLKVVNLHEIILLNLSKHRTLVEEEMKQLETHSLSLQGKIVDSFVNSILKATKFEENLKKNISHEQTISLVEHILEKAQFYLMNLSFINDYNLKESIKEKVKKEIIRSYKEITNKDENLNLSFLSEEELKNYLDII